VVPKQARNEKRGRKIKTARPPPHQRSTLSKKNKDWKHPKTHVTMPDKVVISLARGDGELVTVLDTKSGGQRGVRKKLKTALWYSSNTVKDHLGNINVLALGQQFQKRMESFYNLDVAGTRLLHDRWSSPEKVLHKLQRGESDREIAKRGSRLLEERFRRMSWLGNIGSGWWKEESKYRTSTSRSDGTKLMCM